MGTFPNIIISKHIFQQPISFTLQLAIRETPSHGQTIPTDEGQRPSFGEAVSESLCGLHKWLPLPHSYTPTGEPASKITLAVDQL